MPPPVDPASSHRCAGSTGGFHGCASYHYARRVGGAAAGVFMPACEWCYQGSCGHDVRMIY